MSDASKAVFLSYASQDAAAAQRIAEALRASGVEVWFDRNELTGGDAWDQKIRGQIKSCALFMPVISANTNARAEGYFRLEWLLAVERSRLMSDDHPFLFPVVIDDTSDAVARVPDRFRDVQWTRLNVRDTPDSLARRVAKILGAAAAADSSPAIPDRASDSSSKGGDKFRTWFGYASGLAVMVIGMGFAFRSLWPSRSPEPKSATVAPALPPAVVAPPPPAQISDARKLIQRALEIGQRSSYAHRESLDAMEALASRALALDPTDEEILGHAARFDAWMISLGFDASPARRQQALQRATRAMELAPNSPVARWAKAAVFGIADRSPAMLAEAERIFRGLVTPAAEQAMLTEFGTVLRDLKKFDEAAVVFERAGDPGSAGWNYVFAGRFADARRVALAWPRSVGALHLRLAIEWFGFEDLAAASAIADSLTAEELLSEDLAGDAANLWLARGEPARVLRLLNAFPSDFFSGPGQQVPKRYYTGHAFALLGNIEAAHNEWRTALAQVQERLKTAASEWELQGDRAVLLACLEEKDEAERARRLYFSLPEPANGPGRGFADTLVLALLGRNDEAVVAATDLLHSKNPYDAMHPALRFMPEFSALRTDTRFDRLLRETRPATAQPFDAPVKSDEKSAPADKSVGVLAFADLSAAHDSEYFSDGISEELLNVLAKVPGLKVTARTSAFFFKGKNLPIPEIAQKLGVAYVIEGSVQRAGDKVKIGAQLIKAADGFHVWSDTFTRDAKDVFAVEEEIAGLIAKRLSLKLGVSSAAATASVNPEAFELYVQGRQAWNLRTDEGFSRAEKLLTKAIELEPDFARAHSAMADVWSLRGQVDNSLSAFGLRESPAAARVAAKCELALKLDPRSAEAHASLGILYWNIWRFAESERELREAVQLNANYASAHQWLGRTLLMQGRLDDALIELKEATELDPLTPRILDNYAWALSFAGRYAEAIGFCDRAIALQSTAIQATALKAVTLAEMGRFTEAVELARTLPEKDTRYSMFRVIALGRAGKFAEVEQSLDALVEGGVISKVAGLFALNRYDDAFKAFDPAWVVSSRADYLLFHPVFDPMRGDPRFQKLLATLGLTDAHARAQAWRKAHPPEKPAAK